MAALSHAVGPAGARLRRKSEAVASAGLDPLVLRTLAVVMSGALAGLGGAFLSIGELNLYSDGMTAGRGFIALAAVIFGRWNPFGATAAAWSSDSSKRCNTCCKDDRWLPADALQALPYIAALIALAGVTGSVRAPASDGVPY